MASSRRRLLETNCFLMASSKIEFFFIALWTDTISDRNWIVSLTACAADWLACAAMAADEKAMSPGWTVFGEGPSAEKLCVVFGPAFGTSPVFGETERLLAADSEGEGVLTEVEMVVEVSL